ncbi:type II toxin-antitoxin system RatA family toxin [Kitasatospora brasiliensis]|uniref:type II toxin-antitoxin system RatA family toxin n=1 Tax=Kitasatospora brasiliensis TaxID=3058040 RepID=UPI00292DC090|nr:SRPBCC family protein [Kitasatospora sp. K002]
MELKLQSSVDADFAFRCIAEFEKYPEFVDEVRSVVVTRTEGNELLSEWDIFFRNGPLRWSEVDYFQPAQRRIVFEQTAGDFEIFRGSWQVDAVEDGCAVTFEATFDFGIPSLAGVLEPIATKVLKEAIATIVHQLLGGATVVGDPATAAAVLARIERKRETAAALAV